MTSLIDLIDRVARDPKFRKKFRKDPFGTARAEGYRGTPEEVAQLLGIEATTEEEIVAAVQARLSTRRKDEGGGDGGDPGVRAVAGVRG